MKLRKTKELMQEEKHKKSHYILLCNGFLLLLFNLYDLYTKLRSVGTN